ncbi:MAG: ABC transporter ATP-binding protein [Thermodesulfobacteriota bacterium]|jgi:branched-chain amino acid transport system ATP-binding protein
MIKLMDVETFYGKAHVLKKISMELKEGEIVTLIGANGAGKSTTLKTISGIIHPMSGTIELMGKRVERFSPMRIVRMGVSHVPEGRRVFPDMMVIENLQMGAFVLGNDRKMIEKALERVYQLFPVLKERSGQLAGTLSGGEQQMLAMGRGLMSDPKVYLLDEPSLGLAPKLVDKIYEVIVEVNRQGKTILLVEQNAYLAFNIAHRAYVMETGKIAMEGKASDLLDNEYVKKAYLGR